MIIYNTALNHYICISSLAPECSINYCYCSLLLFIYWDCNKWSQYILFVMGYTANPVHMLSQLLKKSVCYFSIKKVPLLHLKSH